MLISAPINGCGNVCTAAQFADIPSFGAHWSMHFSVRKERARVPRGNVAGRR